MKNIHILEEIKTALRDKKPVVALESAVITHGLPYPTNLDLARGMETEVRSKGVVPATVAVLDGGVHVGLNDAELQDLAVKKPVYKISRRDFAPAQVFSYSGGTTVAGTMIAAHAAGIRVFATGGIGGVHRQAPFDVSPDLPELSRTPVLVVCAGAKSILDLPATLEYLETHGVPVIGWRTQDFPAFFSVSSGLRVPVTVQDAGEVAAIARAHWDNGFSSGLLVVVPPPAEDALPAERMEAVIAEALQEAREHIITGQGVTPFLLEKVGALTGGDSIKANLALLKNNARVAAEIAGALSAALHT